MSSITRYRNRIEQLKGQRNQLLLEIEETEEKLNQGEKKEKNIEEAQRIIQHVAQQTQQELEFHISELVSLALSSIYEDPYKFRLKFSLKRGKTEADPVFIREGKEYKPGKRTGYSTVNIAAFALRISVHNIQNPRLRNVLVLDEPFKDLDKKAKPKAAKLLKVLAKERNLQILMISHDPVFINSADRLFENRKEGNISIIEEVER